MDNLCRTCAKHSDNVQASVFLESRFELKFIDMIKECTSVNISAMDQLPKIICIDCQLKLELSYAFKKQSLQTQQKLIEMFKADVTSNQHHEIIDVIEMKPLNIKPEEIEIFEDNCEVDLAENTLKKSFITKANLNECNRCWKPCNSQKALIEHKKTHIDDLTPVKCYLCGKGFQHKQSLNRHIKTHPPEDRIEIIDPSKFDGDKDIDLGRSPTNLSEDSDLDNSNLFENDESNLPDNLPEFECKRCGKAFHNEELSIEHLDTHSNDLTPYKCYICGNGLQLRSSLKRHIQTQHGSKKSALPLARKARSIEFKIELEGSDTDSEKIPLSDYLNRVDSLDNVLTPTTTHPPEDRIEMIDPNKFDGDNDTELDRSSKNPFENSDLDNSNLFEDDDTTLVKNKKTPDSKPFTCNICDKGFYHKRSLNRHIKTHSPADRIKLAQLEAKQRSLRQQPTKITNSDLKNELEGSDQSDKIPLSDYLNQIDPIENKESTPTKNDTIKGQYVCTVCGKCYTSKVSLSSHNRKHRPPPKPKKIEFKCFKCQEIFTALKLIDEHLEIVHNQERIWCEQCNSFYGSKNLLEEHALNVHQLTCKRCLLKCGSLDEFTEHLETHRNDPLPFKCRFCGKGIKQPYYIIEHTRIHTGERPNICQSCGKSFVSHTNLISHMRIHTDERPYSCKVCSARFRQYNSLRAHERAHDSLRPYTCDKCGKTYRHKANLRFHIKQHLGLIKKSPCTICGKILARGQMISHMKGHTGERKHVCEICQKAFLQPYGLKVHMKTHTGEKPFSCEVCPKKFSQKHVLVAHMNIHQS